MRWWWRTIKIEFLIKDIDNNIGWIHKNLIKGDRHVIFNKKALASVKKAAKAMKIEEQEEIKNSSEDVNKIKTKLRKKIWKTT